MKLQRFRSESSVGLRSQILLMLLGGSIVPLALVGMWLSSSAERSGEDLLRGHLNASADYFVAAVEKRWVYRNGDIAWLSGDESSVRAVTSASLSNEDLKHLDALGSGLAEHFPVIELRDSSGAIKWSSTQDSRSSADRSAGENVPRGGQSPSVLVESAIVAPNGMRLGTAATTVALSSIIPPDSARPLVPGAHLSIRHSESKRVLVALKPGLSFPEVGREQIDGTIWLLAHRLIVGPQLEIVVGAPLAPYVQPFRKAASIGVVALFTVAILAIVVTAMMATRATRPLRELAVASGAITRGELPRHVAVAGPAEMREVGTAFNMMAEHLERTLEQLSRRNSLAAVGEFATSLSHDVRNALTAIKVDLERAAIRDLRDPVADNLVNRALNNVVRLENTVTAALSVARHGSNSTTDIDIRSAIEAAIDTVSGTFAAVPATLVCDLPSHPVVIRGDSGAMETLLSNLLFNAAQALTPGGHARVVVRRESEFLAIDVMDNGRGMSASEMLQLETPFYSSRPNGSGLGLPIARQIVAEHGGDLTIASEEGRGTTVHIRLPLLNTSFTELEHDGPQRVDVHSISNPLNT